MEFPRKQIKANAKAALKGYYWPCVGYPLLAGLIAGLVYVVVAAIVIVGMNLADGAGSSGLLLICGIISFALGIAITIVALVLIAGEYLFFYKAYKAERPEFNTFFKGFKDGQTGRVAEGLLLMVLKVFLWSLLLFIPGIIKAYEYSMVPFLLLDEPNLTISECFKASKQMTTGYKGSLFALDLSFIGWMLLALLTFGILYIFYVIPYYSLAVAGAYDFLKTNRFQRPSQDVIAEQAP